MNVDYLEKLNNVVGFLLRQRTILESIQELKDNIRHTKEPFVWSVIDLNNLECDLPENIKSGWIFVLKKDVPSGSHYHPNSIQHMVMIEGQGRSNIADVWKRMVQFGSTDHILEDIWYVIDEGIVHEFFPEKTDMVVVSFHTCLANELEEISCGTGEKRLYHEEI
jgi:hypothetical protein